MPLLTHFNTPVSEPINSQILQLVVDQLTELISAMEITPEQSALQHLSIRHRL
jgi:hypothetical protein